MTNLWLDLVSEDWTYAYSLAGWAVCQKYLLGAAHKVFSKVSPWNKRKRRHLNTKCFHICWCCTFSLITSLLSTYPRLLNFLITFHPSVNGRQRPAKGGLNGRRAAMYSRSPIAQPVMNGKTSNRRGTNNCPLWSAMARENINKGVLKGVNEPHLENKEEPFWKFRRQK